MGFLALLLFRILSAALLIVLLIWIFHGFFQRVTTSPIRSSLTSSFGYGFLYLIAVPLAVGLAFVSIIGIPAGMIVGSIYACSIALGHVLVSIVLTYWIRARKDMKWSKGQAMLVSVGFYFLIKIMSLIPVIGWLVSVILMAAAFGMILLELSDKREKVETQ